MTRHRRLGIAGALVLAACGVAPTPEPAAVVTEPPDIEFSGVVTDVRIFADRVEFTDARGVVHSVSGPKDYRDVGWSGWDGPLLILGRDDVGPFVAGFMAQDGLPPDCYVQRDPGVERGSHVEIAGILWRKAPGFTASIEFGEPYPPGSRFCLDERGLIDGVVGR
jgi:hypothetical protein